MNHGMKVRQDIGVSVERKRSIIHQLVFDNPFHALHIRKGRIIGQYEGRNDVTIEGKNHMLDVTFGNSSPLTQVDPWYIGLIDQSPVPTLSENDTLASHAAWDEATDYTGNRQAWTDANAAAKVKGTTTVSTFPMTATATIHGIFIASVATGTSGVLWATGSFTSSVPVVNGDSLKITYGVRL